MAYQTINPTTNELLKTYANHTDADIEAALDTAHKLYKSQWSKGPIQPRLQVLERLADLIDARKEELARIATVEMGKLISDARDEVWIIAEIARYYARDAEKFLAPSKIDSRYGLAGAVFSQNIERAKSLASRIETGAVWINTFASTAPELPFGGVKRSGYGRELSELGIKEFVNQKLVLVAKS